MKTTGLADFFRSLQATDSRAKVTVRSALNPLLWIVSALVVVLIAFIFSTEGVPTWFVVIFICVIIAAIYAYYFFALSDPGKLQSEEFQIRMRALDIIEQKGDSHSRLAESTLEAVTDIGGSRRIGKVGDSRE